MYLTGGGGGGGGESGLWIDNKDFIHRDLSKGKDIKCLVTFFKIIQHVTSKGEPPSGLGASSTIQTNITMAMHRSYEIDWE